MSQADGIGWIEVICGSMFSGKTEELIRRVKRAKLAKQKIRIFIKYDHKGESVISGINRVSKPGKRVYVNQNELPRVLDGLGISILSTSKGVISNKVAKRIGVGGEVLCSVW